MNIQTKEQEEAKNTIEQEGAAWATELKLGDVIGCQAQDEDGFQEVKPKTKKKIHSNKYEEDDRRGEEEVEVEEEDIEVEVIEEEEEVIEAVEIEAEVTEEEVTGAVEIEAV
eukprot:CAMPEP_0205801040 /NCGR_PEP_ID=MMETSP0205-20121125/2896_1 /ASSEMBLY_ACC=CAM_ASM_000278 /TAXON_ID=36767 /ORGANISM="Euplotes focardii, Strain TN1" /LENGTH=111 /DNA_ID=CAMNT_0053065125 /DNA_START=743 /DNA_END=1076 /DNA_ORIENTATION=-